MKHYLICLFGISLLYACGSGKTEHPAIAAGTASDTLLSTRVQLSDSQRRMIRITTGRPSAQDIHTTLRVNGSIDVAPENLYSVSFPMSGYLKSSRLIPGAQVRKGQVLAVLEDAQFIQLQQDYLTEKSRLSYARADFERQEELNKTQSNSTKVLQQASMAYETQKVLVRSLQEKLLLIGIDPGQLSEQKISRSVNIYAPITGYVSRVNVNPGKYVAPTDVLFELTDPSRLHLSLHVFEKDAQSLQIGQKVSCYTNAAPDKRMEAEIQLISPSLNDARAVEVHCHFDRPYGGLIPGLFMSAEIRQDAGTAQVLPEDAVVRWQNKYYVFVEQEPNVFVMQQVSIGRSADRMMEVTSALPDLDVVTGNAYALLMMLKNSPEG